MGKIQQYPTLIGHCLDRINTTGLFAGLEKSLKTHLSDFKFCIFLVWSLIPNPLIPPKSRSVHKLHQAQLKLSDSHSCCIYFVSLSLLYLIIQSLSLPPVNLGLTLRPLIAFFIPSPPLCLHLPLVYME